jgi:hypothetical protein
MHLIVKDRGIIEIKSKGFFAKLFCKHVPITGEHCSSIGLTRISGRDIYTVCEKCGKVINSEHTTY